MEAQITTMIAAGNDALLFRYARQKLDAITAEAPQMVTPLYEMAQARSQIVPEYANEAARFCRALEDYREAYAWFSGPHAAAAAAAYGIQLTHTADGLRRGTFKDGRRSTVRVYCNVLLEVRRGDLTGYALVDAGQQIFRDWDEWVAFLEA